MCGSEEASIITSVLSVLLLHLKVYKEGDGYWAASLELPGCATEADSIEELRANAEEALNLYLDEPKDSSLSFPLPMEYSGADIIEIPVDPSIALAVLLRKYREDHHYSQKEIADRLGMKNLYSYQRLERRSNPSLSTLRKLKDVFPDFSLDYILR
jgi:predicted RNase H-like HicB family nuclease/DNA-binding XRE family transcriptional regulator